MPDKRPRDLYVRSADLGLPSEEYTLLKKRKNGALLYTHLKDVHLCHHVAYTGRIRHGPKPDLPRKMPGNTANLGKRRSPKHTDRVLQESQIASATRQALGPSWHPIEYLYDDLEYSGVPRVSSDRNDQLQEKGPIPDIYLQEFNRMWYEDDEDNDADQLLADLTPNAPWRNHLPLRPMYGPDGEFRTSTQYFDEPEIMRWDEATHEAHMTRQAVVDPEPLIRPKLQSFFSWSDSSIQEERREKKLSWRHSPWKRLKKSFREMCRT
jgi:hypothetical protein